MLDQNASVTAYLGFCILLGMWNTLNFIGEYVCFVSNNFAY